MLVGRDHDPFDWMPPMLMDASPDRRGAAVSRIPARHRPKLTGRRSFLLDTNVWRYVVDRSEQGALRRAARVGGSDILVAPAVVFETLRMKDAGVRDPIVRLMADPHFVRLMPEAYSESWEILEEIERVRPEWLRQAPDLRFFDRLYKDWSRRTGGFWVRCERDPGAQARFVDRSEVGMREGSRAEYQNAREEMRDSGWRRNPPMDKTKGGFPSPVPGWDGTMVDAWRIQRLQAVTYGLRHVGDPYRDWLAPFVDLDGGLLGSSSWNDFWLHLAEDRALPRQWLRWAHSFAQRFRKLSPGSPGDTQLFTYLSDADHLVTSDRALVQIVDECRPFAPCGLAEGRLVPAGAAGVGELLSMLGA